MIHRYTLPLISLADAWHWKLFFAGLFTAVIESSGRLFIMDADLVVLVVLLVILDLITGVIKAIRKRTFSSMGLRQTSIKAVEYSLLLFTANSLANAFMYKEIPIVSDTLGVIGTLAFCYVAIVEAISVCENVFGSTSRARKIFTALKAHLSKEGIPDELTNNE
jgi:phosphoribulokinase